ncbi:SlyX family protein [Salaquimonas pukyongi]|uniref:SlyX family protein n=1 Tax=Salaquimonas pukyongi TaxID=2712698 RepID=UPI00096BC8E3|nr:SlyX family protein [Salaquimonas pukyongi]
MTAESFADKEQRIVRLEEQLAYQAETIEELSAAMARQWEELDKAKRKLDALAERFLALEETTLPGAEATKPPHY